MTPLNNRLKLALISRQKHNNLLQKGFTLVELMIVIVIVGILSAVALPNFLNQTDKAKGTECTSKATGILKQVSAEALSNTANADALGKQLADTETTNSDLCAFVYGEANTEDLTQLADAAAANDDLIAFVSVTAATSGDFAGKYAATACLNATNTKQEIIVVTGATQVAALGTGKAVPDSSTTPAAPDCA